MDTFATDNLILLEFLVDSLNLDYTAQQSLGPMEGDMCVSFQFLENTPLKMCENDFSPKIKGGGMCIAGEPAKTKNGKSCLFALSSEQAETCLKQFDVYIDLFKDMKPAMLPNKVDIGGLVVSISNLFSEVVKASKNSDGIMPVAKTLKDTFSVMDTKGNAIGKISIFIRMSCFGKLIVTQFQMNLQDKSVEFKAKEGNYLFKYNKKDARCPTNIDFGDPCAQSDYPPSPGTPPPPRPSCNPPSKCPPSSILPPCPSQPCPSQCQPLPCCVPQCAPPACCVPQCAPPACCVPQCPPPACCLDHCPPHCPLSVSPSVPPCCSPQCPPQSSPQPVYYIDPCTIYKMQMQHMKVAKKPPCFECSLPSPSPQTKCVTPKGEYQEIGAEMGGNSLVIRVHKDSQKIEASKNSGCEKVTTCNKDGQQQQQEHWSFSNNSTEECPLSTSEWHLSPGCLPSGSCQSFGYCQPCGCCPSPGCCASPACCSPPGCYPPYCCPPNPQPIICTNPCDPNSPFSLKVNGASCQPANNISVTPPVSTPAGECKMADVCDPDKEMFILRIGKKSEKTNKKNKLELELCTPKAKDLKPPPKMETRDTQCEVEDFPKQSAVEGAKAANEKPTKAKKGKK